MTFFWIFINSLRFPPSAYFKSIFTKEGRNAKRIISKFLGKVSNFVSKCKLPQQMCNGISNMDIALRR